MRLLIVQYIGDYREAFQRFAAGEEETYYAQKYSVDFVAKLGQQVEQVGVLCCITTEVYDEVLENGVRAIGAGFQGEVNFDQIVQKIAQFRPTHLVINTPVRKLLKWVTEQQLAALVVIADSFQATNLKTRITNFLLSRRLNHPNIHWVCNHGVTASDSLQKLGVNPNKIIPWDWPHRITPRQFEPKCLSAKPDGYDLVYVGSISETKGVGDAIRAVAKLRSDQFPVRLKLAGRGEIAPFKSLAEQLNLTDHIEFLGLVPNPKIVHLMRSADLVLVPSRPEYPEGFPMTIYESLCSRTPVVASTHPMFVKRLQHRSNAMLFRASDPAACADSIREALSQPDLYHQISQATEATWQRLQLPVQWGTLIQRWLENNPENHHWLYQHRLASGQYDVLR
ncbi:MAG: glycosyltransferase [Elainella sp. Prado103]|jgi:glycosyltransferase involved in cell wall biosynthesis|nr:glycosyltransferase [Elainella sp. Prado103]